MNNPSLETYEMADALPLNEIDYLNPIYDLEERPIPEISTDFLTPIEIINKKLKTERNHLINGHINACSIPHHYDEIQRTMNNTDIDILAVSETFICEKTPKMLYEIPGYKF